jgi:hypothetical protein
MAGMTVAPMQRDMFTRRYRRVRAQPSEFQIQVAVIRHLRLRGRPDITCWHTPNGELRDRRHAAKLKAMGTLPGVADLIFVFPNAAPLLCLELKAPGRKLTPAQKAFAYRMRASGHNHECADSIDAALGILNQYRVFKTSRETQ